ncbi:MAG: hypothetical protein JWN30_729, partial [Bacilli bacterium]|nr:hypothetical protein [Bacilli bacterium]
IGATLEAIQGGKEQVFAIAESARKEKMALEAEAELIRKEVDQLNLEADQMEIDYHRSRHLLAQVSSNFTQSTERVIREAYDESHSYQIKLLLARERQARLQVRRDELVYRLRRTEDTIQRAEKLVSQLSVVFSYLSGDLQLLGAALKTVEERQTLGFQIIQAQEEERRRVAREIHDGPAQMMANVVLRAEICEKMLDRDPERVRVELSELKLTVRESLVEVRTIISDLRPMALEVLGLIPALRKYAAVFEENFRIPVNLRFFGSERRLSQSIEVALFRTVQECLTNAYKHAKATEITVRIELLPDQVNLQVQDDGVGFTAEEQFVNDGKHFGLLGMRERIALFDGKLDLRSSAGSGTKIIVQLPLGNEGGKSNAAL